MKETAIRFGREHSLVGVLTLPEKPYATDVAILLLNAGLVHHVGPNRIYVRLARQLAAHGFTVLRFDLSGVGDSEVRYDNVSFEQGIVDDARQAMDELADLCGSKRFILIGHCSGAARSFVVSLNDVRVAGMVLLNPEVEWQDRRESQRGQGAEPYNANGAISQAIHDPKRWKRFLTGRANYARILQNVSRAIRRSGPALLLAYPQSRQHLMDTIHQISARKMPVLFVCSAGGKGLELLQTMLGGYLDMFVQSGQIQFITIEGADQTFILRNSQNQVIEAVERWCTPFVQPLAVPFSDTQSSSVSRDPLTDQ